MAEEQQSVSIAPVERAPALPADEICPGTLQLSPSNDQAISASNSGTIALDEGQAPNDKPGSDDAEEESDSDAEEESDIDIDDESYNDVDSFGADSVELLKLKKEFWDNDESGRVGKLRYGERLIKSNVEKRSANKILWPAYDRNKLTTSAYEDLIDFSIEAKRADLYAMVMKWKLDGGVEKLHRSARDVFERSLRKACLMKGYLLYTLDKLLEFSLSFIQGMIVTDGKKTNPHRARSANVLLMYQRDRERSEATERGEEQDLMAYQRRVDGLLGMKDAMFRIELHEDTKMVTMCSVTRGKYPVVVDMDTEAEWNSYIESYIKSYIMPAPTEGVPIDRCRKVFLHRNLPREKNTPEARIRKDGQFF
ncbi:Transcriptional regulatory protein sin3 [Rhizina undulata]